MIQYLNNPNASHYWEICGFGFVMGCLGFFKTNSKLPLSAINFPVIDSQEKHSESADSKCKGAPLWVGISSPWPPPIPFLWDVPMLSLLSSVGPGCPSLLSILCWPSVDQGMQSEDYPMQGWNLRFPGAAWLPRPLSVVQVVMPLIKVTWVPSFLLLCQTSPASAESFSCQPSASGSIALGYFSQVVFPTQCKILLLLPFVVS